MSGAYYNEHDPNAAAWLRELIKAGHIASGEVDERSIEDVRPDDLAGFTQCHFFAGIGGWSLALRLAGWPDDRAVWTGSCPCQPFSAAGKGAGFVDERHLWPAFYHLIEQCGPRVVFGEQVASKDGLAWLDLVHADLEAAGYAFAAVDLCAAGIGAPHIRQRLWFVADSDGGQPRIIDIQRSGLDGLRAEDRRNYGASGDSERPEAPARLLADAAITGSQDGRPRESAFDGSAAGLVADAESSGAGAGLCDREPGTERRLITTDGGTIRSERPGPTNGQWGTADWLLCRDGKWRPVSASPQPLVDGIPESLGRVRDEDIQALEEEVNAWEVETGIRRSEGLRDLWNAAYEAAPRVWPAGGIPGLHEAPFLLAFMRQLAWQGWRITECVSLPGAQIPQGRVRVLWSEVGATCPSHQLQLEGQPPGEYSDALRVLSSILARRAYQAWEIAHAAYAETCFPLSVGARGRVQRLRGYGNAIVPSVAAAFIEAYQGVIEP